MRRLLLATAATWLGGCDQVTLGSAPAGVNACRPSQTFFIDQIWPNFIGKDYGGKTCGDSRCHDRASGNLLTVVPPTSAPAVPLPSDWADLYKSVTEQTRCTNVRSSPILTRPDGEQTHGGGKLIEPDGPEALLVQMWVVMK